MLHRISPPACSERLRQAVDLQRQLIEFACAEGTATPLTRTMIMAAFPSYGEWLCARLSRSKQAEVLTGTTLNTHLTNLINFVQANAASDPQANAELRQAIVDAFPNDRDFDQGFNDEQFSFHFLKLDKKVQNVIKPVMVHFYDPYFAKQSLLPRREGEPELNRQTFLDAFDAANPSLKVCPGCDGPRSEKRPPDSPCAKPLANDVADARAGKGRPTDDLDHFLPKSRYPFLAVHPYNLVPLCSFCNSKMKLAKDPIDDPNVQPLLHSFHPYLRAAYPDEIEVIASRDKRMNVIYRLHDRPPREPRSRRVKNLNRVLRLEWRWRDREPHKAICNNLLETGQTLERYIERQQGRALTSDERRMALQDAIETLISNRPTGIGRDKDAVPGLSYLHFINANQTEFARLLDQFLPPYPTGT